MLPCGLRKKNEEEVWSLVKIFKLMSIVPDVLFGGFLQNFRYSVVRGNNVAFEFTIVDFPLMNLDDLITVTKILCNVNGSKVAGENRSESLLGLLT